MNPLWHTLAARAAIVLTPEQTEQLSRYLDLLFAANATMNLTRITDRPAAELQHVADSLTLLPLLPAEPHTLVDVGSGGGVPGIPLAIARPDVQVLLVESTKKKAAFLERAAMELGLHNIRISAERAEDVGLTPATREAFDVAVVRAVATLNWLVEWCLPLLKTGGVMFAMKGPKVVSELPSALRPTRALGGGPPTVHSVDLDSTTGHVIVQIPKISRTDGRYPRRATQAKGNPLA